MTCCQSDAIEQGFFCNLKDPNPLTKHNKQDPYQKKSCASICNKSML